MALDILEAAETKPITARGALDANLRRSGLTRNHRAYVTDLVYGVLRWKARLDWLIAAAGGASRDPLISLFRLAAYEMDQAEGRPEEIIESARALAGQRMGERPPSEVDSFLQRLAQGTSSPSWPSLSEDPITHISIVQSHPRWLVERWVERWGVAETLALCAANNRPALRTLRTNLLRTSREELQARLQTADRPSAPGQLTESLYLLRPGPFTHLVLFRQGFFFSQDEASMLVAYIVDPQPGEAILDACAAPGGKTTHLAERMGDQGQIVAGDVDRRRLEQVRLHANRLGLNCVAPRLLDAREAGSRLPAAFDRVLVDAPCSGLGTLRRRPEVRWRYEGPSALAHWAHDQLALLKGVAPSVKPGGVLVYSTCTLEAAENECVVARFLREHPEFGIENVTPWTPPNFHSAVTPEGYLQTRPHRHGTDGFFIARLRRTGPVHRR